MHKPRSTPGFMAVLAAENTVYRWRITAVFGSVVHTKTLAGWPFSKPQWMNPHSFSAHALTGCAHNLPIQTLANTGYLLAHNVIEFYAALNFFDRVNGGSVVFAPQLMCNARKAHV